MADKENKEEVKKEELKETKQVQKETKKEEKPKNEKTDKKEEKVKTEVKKEDKKEDKVKVEIKKEEKTEAKKEDKKEEKNKVEVKEETKKQEPKTETKKFEVSKQKTTVSKEKNNTNKKSKVPAILTVIIVLAIVALLTVLIVTSSDPKKSVDGFLTNLKAGDFEKAQEFATGDSLLKDQEYSEETQKLFFDKISWKVKKVTAENDKAKVEIEITNKDFEVIVQNCMKKLLSNFKAVLEGNVSEKSIEKYFVEELKSDNVQMKTETKTIELQKQDGKWKVVANNELANSLLPGLQESVNALQ